MKKSLFNEVVSIARSKMHLHPEFDHFLHFTFIIQDNKVIEWGMNHAGMPRKHYGYHKDDITFVPKTHAEVDSYKKARGLLDKSKSFLAINIRLNRFGELRMSKPCKCCYNLLKNLGCKRFYYSSNVGFLTTT
jgi:hypothetical protein